MLENAVRPFTNNGAVVSRGIASVRTRKIRGQARLIWGDVGTLPAADKEADATDPATYGFKLEQCDDGYKESSRKTKSKRIENPNDSEQYIMVDQIQLISFEHQTDSKIVGAFSSETTAFADTNIGTSHFNNTKGKSDKCKATYTLTDF